MALTRHSNCSSTGVSGGPGDDGEAAAQGAGVDEVVAEAVVVDLEVKFNVYYLIYWSV